MKYEKLPEMTTRYNSNYSQYTYFYVESNRLTSVEVLQELGEETDNVVESTSKLQEKIKALTGVDVCISISEANAVKGTIPTILNFNPDVSKLLTEVSNSISGEWNVRIDWSI